MANPKFPRVVWTSSTGAFRIVETSQSSFALERSLGIDSMGSPTWAPESAGQKEIVDALGFMCANPGSKAPKS